VGRRQRLPEAETALEQAYRELEEEVGLGRDDVRLLAEDEPLVLPDESIGMRWTVYPFLFEALRPEGVRLDWEHTESRWVRPEELSSLETVPGLAEGFQRLHGG
jgi:8-oxo-dGTP pyrophosphatase MutT (NUDIX family)